MNDATVISDLVRALVEEELSRQSGTLEREVDPGEKRRRAEDLALSKRAAQWIGARVPTPPGLGTWRAEGSASQYLAKTPARLAIGRAGTRYRTERLQAFLADHAAARDAVASAVDPRVISSLGMIPLNSAAPDKRTFLARPELGRRLSPDSENIVRQKGQKGLQVQLAAVDGLSAAALSANLPLILPPLLAQFARLGIRTGTSFVVNNGRVAAGDHLARLTGAEVLCLLVGERPGLKTAESMGAYITYMRAANFNEAMRYVISNIHRDGLPPDDAAAQIASLCRRALDEKKTGVDFSS